MLIIAETLFLFVIPAPPALSADDSRPRLQGCKGERRRRRAARVTGTSQVNPASDHGVDEKMDSGFRRR
jgi:hypothetical protein